MNFRELFESRDWSPIPHCEGRFRLAHPEPTVTPSHLAAVDHSPTVHRVSTARDEVCVLRIDGGALISYLREDGSYLHTLNTPEGLVRKLSQLGIDSAEPPHPP